MYTTTENTEYKQTRVISIVEPMYNDAVEINDYSDWHLNFETDFVDQSQDGLVNKAEDSWFWYKRIMWQIVFPRLLEKTEKTEFTQAEFFILLWNETTDDDLYECQIEEQ